MQTICQRCGGLIVERYVVTVDGEMRERYCVACTRPVERVARQTPYRPIPDQKIQGRVEIGWRRGRKPRILPGQSPGIR